MAAFTGPVSTSQVTQVLISSMDYVTKPQVYKKLVNQYPTQGELGWLKEYGMFESVAGASYNWHESNKIMDNPVIASIAQIGATNGVRITLAAGSHQNSGTSSYPRKDQIVKLQNNNDGLIRSKSTTTPSAHTIDVYPVKNTLTYAQFTTGIAAAQQFILLSNAFAEVTNGQSQSVQPTTTVFTNKIQKFSETYKITQSEIGNETWFTIDGENGGKVNALYLKGLIETELRFQMAEEMALFAGQASETGLLDANGEAVHTTEGMITTLDARGTGQTYTTTIDYDFYDAVCKKMSKNHGGTKSMLLMGENFESLNTQFLIDMGNSGSIVYAKEESNKIIDATFGSFALNGRTFQFKKLGILSHAELLGTTGFTYADRAIFMPDPTVKTYVPKMGISVSPFTVMYKPRTGPTARDGGKYAMDELGFNASRGATDSEDSKKVLFYSDKGARTFIAKQFINVTKA